MCSLTVSYFYKGSSDYKIIFFLVLLIFISYGDYFLQQQDGRQIDLLIFKKSVGAEAGAVPGVGGQRRRGAAAAQRQRQRRRQRQHCAGAARAGPQPRRRGARQPAALARLCARQLTPHSTLRPRWKRPPRGYRRLTFSTLLPFQLYILNIMGFLSR